MHFSFLYYDHEKSLRKLFFAHKFKKKNDRFMGLKFVGPGLQAYRPHYAPERR